jgi:hypothetical protein
MTRMARIQGINPDGRSERQRAARLVASIDARRIQTTRGAWAIRTLRMRHDGPAPRGRSGAFIGCLGLASAVSAKSAVHSGTFCRHEG